MRYYTDVRENRAGLDMLDELDGLAERFADRCRATMHGEALDIARNGLIVSGMLEQALADDSDLHASSRRSARTVTAAAEALSDWWADRLVTQREAAGPAPRPSTATLAVPRSVVVPEGYLFYTLFPDFYARVGREMAKESTQTRFVVIGIRSIGTSLSAAFAAGIRSADGVVARHTVRPIGDPFSRELVVAPDVLRAWREAVNHGASFVAVDEGPGLSGSSLASVVRALHMAGVPAHRIVIVCAHVPGSLPRAGSDVQRLWQTTAVKEAAPAGEQMLAQSLPRLLSGACNTTFCVDRDVSWGRWRERAAPLLPLFERRKFLLRDQAGDQVVAKFVGFGSWGARKALRTRKIAERGAAPPFRGYAHGFLVQDWVGEPLPVEREDSRSADVLDAAAAYYARLRLDAGTSDDAMDLTELVTTVDDIRNAWFGAGVGDDLGAAIQRAAAGSPRAFDGDQRPELIEWRRWGTRLMKCDTADHFLDHSWARRQDIAFDLAGFIDEWDLDRRQRERFIATYIRKSGDNLAPDRMPYFRCVYHAHRLAMHDTAYHAGMDDGDGTIARKRQSAGEHLATALAVRPVVLCD